MKTRYFYPEPQEGEPVHARISKIRQGKQVTTLRYNKQGSVIEQKSDRAHLRFEYHATGQLHRVHDHKRDTTLLHHELNEQGLVKTEYDVDNQPTHYHYDGRGLVTKVNSHCFGESTFQYDANGNLVERQHQSMNREVFHYNADNQVIQYQDAANNTTQIDYQGLPFATKRTHADGHTLCYQYDSELNLTGLINENKQQYQLRYDDKERLIEEIGFDGNRIQYQYAPNDFLTQKQDGNQAWQQHVRDPLGRLKQILYQDGQQTEFEYDEQGRLTKAQNGQHTTEFEYNAEHQLCAQIQDGVKLEYDTTPNHHSLILPDGKNITYHLGKQHKLSHITVDNKELSRYEYDDKGFEVKQTLGAMALLQQYDPYGRLIEQRGMSLFASGAHNATLSSRRYLYDKAGRIAQIQRHFGGHQTFQYDNRNRLTQSEASDFTHHYQFDAASNLVLEPEKPQESNPVYTLHYNTGEVDGVHIPRIVNNQLPENHKQDVRYRYDERGNRILASHGNGIVQTHYRYDTQNQLIQLEYFTGPHTTQKLNFTYDALGRRCAKYVTTYSNNRPVSQYRVDFLWDGNVLLAEQKVELDITTEPEKHPKPSFNKPDAIYIHRPNSFEPLMQLRQPEPQEIPKQDYLPKPTYSVYYYLNDHLGTPQELLNKWGELVWQARTSPYGEILKLGKNKIENPIRLPGQYEDSESGLYYNRFRYYSPQDGGYINRDPIGLLGGDNLYDYPRDPVGWVDPFGLSGFFTPSHFDAPSRISQTVYQQNIDWDLPVNTRDGIKTNLELAMEGRSPFTVKNGQYSIITLHHSKQNAKGSLFELSASTHNKYHGSNALHPYYAANGQKHPFNPVDHNAFKADREAYWKQRAQNEIDARAKIKNKCK